VVELNGYNRIADNTYPNMMALLTGKLARERPAGPIDNTELLWRHFKSIGYKTLYAEDSLIFNQIFNIWAGNDRSPGGFIKQPTDFYYRPLSVVFHGDKEIVQSLDGWHCRFCIGSTFETEFIFNWASMTFFVVLLWW